MTNPTRHPMLSRLLCAVLLLDMMLLSACKPAAATIPTAPATAAASATATRTPRPSSTPTAAPTALPTETLQPSATPAGFYSHYGTGYALTYPSSWHLSESTSSDLAFEDLSAGLVFLMRSSTEKEARSIDKVAEDIKNEFPEGSEFVPGETSQTALADGVEAKSIDLTVKFEDETRFLRVTSLYQNGREYSFIMISFRKPLDTFARTFDRLYGSIQVFAPQPFGLEHDQTLVELGGEPDPESLDPALSQSSAGDYIGLLYSGLVRLTPQMQVVPDLAASWEISEGGKVYTFTLRDEAQFASGKPITAEDVVNSWERAADPKLGSKTARTYLGDIQGVKNRLDKGAAHISGLKAVNEHTLQVTLDAPKPYFLAKISYPTAYVLNTLDASVSAADWVYDPDATGPYQVKEYREGEGLVLERNPAYHTQPAVPYLAFMFSARGAPLSLYEEGTIDLAPVYGEDAVRVKKPGDPLHGELVETPMMCTDLLQLDTSRAPLDDPNVRRALALAIDKDTISEKLTAGTALTAISVLPPAMPGYSEDLPSATFDPDAAKAALAESRYKSSPLTLTLNAMGFADSQREDVKLLVDMWNKTLGIKVNVEYIEPADYTAVAREAHAHMVLYSWCADYPDPENFLDLLYHSESDFNVSGYHNPDLDALLEQARIEQDTVQRLSLYHQAETLLLEDGAVIPLLHSMRSMLVKPRVQGFVLPPVHTATHPWLSLDPSQETN